jgi:hypothetical protein
VVWVWQLWTKRKTEIKTKKIFKHDFRVVSKQSIHIVFSQIKHQLEIEKDRKFHGCSRNVCSTIRSKIIWEESFEKLYRVILLNFSHFYWNWNNWRRISMQSTLAIIEHESFISQLVAQNNFWVILFYLTFFSVIHTQNSCRKVNQKIFTCYWFNSTLIDVLVFS